MYMGQSAIVYTIGNVTGAMYVKKMAPCNLQPHTVKILN